jgi:hypothetical protein
LNVDQDGKFLSGRIIPAFQPWPGGVKYDSNKLVIKKIIELTAVDFPESLINISEDGKITYK